MHNFAVMKRPKKPSLESIREKKFSAKITGMKHLPNREIIDKIDSKIFSLDANRLFHYKPEVLAAEEYKRCLELFERRLPNEFALPTYEAMATLQHMNEARESVMFHKEMKNHEELQQLAVSIIRDMFDVPDHVNLLPEITSTFDLDSDEQDDSPDEYLSLSEEDKIEMRDEIQKRIILNGLVHGAAMHIWKSAHYIIKEEVDKIDPILMNLYDEYTTSISWLIWQMPPDQVQDAIGAGGAITQGFNELEFEEEGEPECNVHCHAVNFPVLLHEMTKGAIDYLICRGIPSGYNEEQLKYYYAKADDYENELWHYYMSPTIWIKLVMAADVTTQEMPAVIANLTELSYKELTDVLRACIDDPESGKMKLKVFKIV